MKGNGRNRRSAALAALLALVTILGIGVLPGQGAAAAESPATLTDAAASHQEPAVATPPPPPVAPPAVPDVMAIEPRADGSRQPADAPPAVRRQRVHELVSVGSSVEVRENQSASEVVVVHGDVVIKGEVRGDLVVVFGKVRIDGEVRGDVVVVLGDVEVNGSVRGDTSLVMTRSRFGPSAKVQGEVMVVGVAPDVDPGASLKSTPQVISLGPLMTYFEGAKDYIMQGLLLLRPFPPRVGWAWVAAGAFLVFHLILAWLLAQPLKACMETVRLQPARSFLVGLLVCVLVGPVSLLLSFTLIAPLLIWVAFFALGAFGRVAVYGAAGAGIGRSAGLGVLGHPVVAVFVGSLVLYLVYMIPVIGLMIYALALPLGVGAVTLRIVDAIAKERPPITGVPGSGGYAAASTLMSGAPGPATHAFDPAASVPGSGPGPGTAATPGVVSAEPGAGAAAMGLGEPPLAPNVVSAAVPPPVSDSGTAGAVGGTPPPQGPPPVFGPGPGPVPPSRVIPLAGVEALAMPRVGFWPRLGASLIDVVLIGVINLVTFQSAQAFWVMWAAYHILLWTWRGTTLGGSVLNLKLVRLDGRPMDWQTSVVRVLGAVVSLVPLGIGFFWASWDAERQAWHDRIAGTTIVKPDRRVSLV